MINPPHCSRQHTGPSLWGVKAGSVPPEEVRQAFGSLDRLWDELFPAEQARIVQLLLEEVRVYSDRLDVRLKAEGLEALLLELHHQEEDVKERKVG